MRKEDVLLLDRGDVIKQSEDKDINLLNLSDFRTSIKQFQKVGFVLFVDDDGQTRILKNRYNGIAKIT